MMKAEFLNSFNILREYISREVPELGNIITHWEDPFTVNKNSAIMLPDSHAENAGKLTFNVILWASTLEKNADAIAQTQMDIMEKIFKAVYSDSVPFMGAGINGADYFDPTPQSPNVGIMRVMINILIEQLDDCL